MLKKQLEELHPILNAFKSEAVQLRIVELIWGSAPEQSEAEADYQPSGDNKPRKRRRRSSGKSNGKAEATSPASKKPRSGRPGPATILAELTDEGFFAERHTLKDIIAQASSQKARNFKQNDLSGLLGKLVRDKKLSREKNDDGQYEYWK